MFYVCCDTRAISQLESPSLHGWWRPDGVPLGLLLYFIVSVRFYRSYGRSETHFHGNHPGLDAYNFNGVDIPEVHFHRQCQHNLSRNQRTWDRSPCAIHAIKSCTERKRTGSCGCCNRTAKCVLKVDSI